MAGVREGDTQRGGASAPTEGSRPAACASEGDKEPVRREPQHWHF